MVLFSGFMRNGELLWKSWQRQGYSLLTTKLAHCCSQLFKYSKKRYFFLLGKRDYSVFHLFILCFIVTKIPVYFSLIPSIFPHFRDTTVQSLTLQPSVKDGLIIYEDSPLVSSSIWILYSECFWLIMLVIWFFMAHWASIVTNIHFYLVTFAHFIWSHYSYLPNVNKMIILGVFHTKWKII